MSKEIKIEVKPITINTTVIQIVGDSDLILNKMDAPTTRTLTDQRKDLENNAPCISAFGLKKSFGQAVVRNGIDKYATKFDACMNIVAENNLVPISFVEHHIDEKLMSPKRGAPVLVKQNRFTGWSAEITIQYLDDGAFSLEQIIQVINYAGFSMGIGSGRTSGYGRYHIVGVK